MLTRRARELSGEGCGRSAAGRAPTSWHPGRPLPSASGTTPGPGPQVLQGSGGDLGHVGSGRTPSSRPRGAVVKESSRPEPDPAPPGIPSPSRPPVYARPGQLQPGRGGGGRAPGGPPLPATGGLEPAAQALPAAVFPFVRRGQLCTLSLRLAHGGCFVKIR